jgi:phi13 family phage major tail protein
MAKVGMRHLVYAKVATETPGTSITYTGGADMAPARRGNVTFDRPDNPLYGDDVMQDNDNGITGVTVEVETTDLAAGVEADLLGYVADTTDSTLYSVTDAAAPYVGFGYVQVLRRRGTMAYRAVWFPKVQFGMDSEETNTKENNIEWGTPVITGKGFGVYLDATGAATFRLQKECATLAAAQSFLDTKAGISRT